MADGHDAALRAGVGFVRQDFFRAGEDKMPPHLSGSHRGGFDGREVILADAPEIFLRDGANFRRRFFAAETHLQISQRHAPMPGVQPEGRRAARPAEPRDERKRQRLNERDDRAGEPVKQRVHFLTLKSSSPSSMPS